MYSDIGSLENGAIIAVFEFPRAIDFVLESVRYVDELDSGTLI